ncbi:hypothetical protein Bca52824_017414 [Brassica carinata]|uniref:DUF4283 domain-containing protein n=1 Tax=Brassica carinata TaxID=52824 RepID=A0A8X8AYA4_BRACI|nr:hypothetical protein Bca52824_017414 [Brassica carinata]
MSQSQWMVKSGGKKTEMAKPRIKISVPRFDNSKLIAGYAKTLIGRCMNPLKQDMKILLFMLPRIWQVEGRVIGSDLGLGRFQFAFESEEDIIEVLKMETFHSDYWMVPLVRWKPILDVNYPSKITFWVRVLDVPLQYWAVSTFQSVGEALGQVQGEVDLMEGRVRVELDGFKPLVFSMEVDFDEGVELVVNLRYEKLFGFCKECFFMTHDQMKCPTLVSAVEEGPAMVESKPERGSHVTSYKAVVSNGKESGGEHRDVHHVPSREVKDGNKGKGIVRDKQGSYRSDIGAYRAYKERFPRGSGEGSSRGGRHLGYGAHRGQHERFSINSRGLRNLRPVEEGRDLSDPQKLMLDAFKGAKQLLKVTQEMQSSVLNDGDHSKARKSLHFDEEVAAILPDVSLQEDSKSLRMVVQKPLVGEVLSGEEALKEDFENENQSFLDDANLMLEGVLLSDSELLDVEWEEGEVPEFMEDEENVAVDEEVGELAETGSIIEDNRVKEDNKAKTSKKKGLKTGLFGGTTKRRLVQDFISPRKNKISKGPTKNGDNGNGNGKKVSAKPKEGNE